MQAQLLQWYPTLCDPMDCSPPGSSVHGILRARILEWVAISFSRGASWHRDWTWVSWIGRWIHCHWAAWEVHKVLIFSPKYLRILKTTMASPRTKSPSQGRTGDVVSSRPLESQVSSAALEFWKGVEGESQILPWRSGSPQILHPDPLSLAQASSWPLI